MLRRDRPIRANGTLFHQAQLLPAPPTWLLSHYKEWQLVNFLLTEIPTRLMAKFHKATNSMLNQECESILHRHFSGFWHSLSIQKRGLNFCRWLFFCFLFKDYLLRLSLMMECHHVASESSIWEETGTHWMLSGNIILIFWSYFACPWNQGICTTAGRRQEVPSCSKECCWTLIFSTVNSKEEPSSLQQLK